MVTATLPRHRPRARPMLRISTLPVLPRGRAWPALEVCGVDAEVGKPDHPGVERAKKISHTDIQAEGIELVGNYRAAFREKWDQVNGKREHGAFAWAQNP